MTVIQDITFLAAGPQVNAVVMQRRFGEKMNKKELAIPLSSAGLGLLTFVLGYFTRSLIISAAVGEMTSFSTLDLINFVLSIVLSSASIILAITAIILSRHSEDSLSARNNEGIRLQNEAFLRTTEVLGRIESSTGVTEKRLEDIISGRVGDISSRIAEIATSRQTKSRNEIEKEIRRSILGGIRRDSEKSEEEKRRESAAEENRRVYSEFHQKVLRAFANRRETHTVKIHHGSFKAEGGEELFDGIYEVNGNKIGVSAIPIGTTKPREIAAYIMSVAKDIITCKIKCAFLFLYEADVAPFSEYFKNELAILKNNPTEHIRFISANNENVEKTIEEITLAA